ncbi:hypothetical protein BGX29_007369 [Mortierella sp. GBA35]|nr:hypothetical protein BGX29_007369 [Mortierella sp. GBA35]
MIKLRVGHGESGSVDLEAVQGRIREIQHDLSTFDLRDIYSCDETGLYLQAISNKSLDNKHFRCRKVVHSTKHKPRYLPRAVLNEVDLDTSGDGHMETPVFAVWLRDLDDDIWLRSCGHASRGLGITEGCIRNCFAQVPVLSRPQSADLKNLGVESAHHQEEDLHRELIAKFHYLENAIASQNDIGVRNYLDMIYSDGPDHAMVEAVRKTVSKDNYKSMFFLENIEDICDDEDDEETEDEEEDSDFDISDNVFTDDEDEPTLVLRSMNAYAPQQPSLATL